MKQTLSNSQIARILDDHGIHHYNHNGHIFALAVYTHHTEVEDLTGSTLQELRWWLGY